MDAVARPSWRDLSGSSIRAFEEAAAVVKGPVDALALLIGIRRAHPRANPVDALLSHFRRSFDDLRTMRTGSPASGDEAPSPDYRAAVEYLRDLESGLRYWYQAAEIKAQVILAINGAFVAFLQWIAGRQE
jgi:hypothetical protein